MINPLRGGWAAVLLGVLALGTIGCGGRETGGVPFGRVYRVGIAPWVMDAQQKKVVDAFLGALDEAGYSSKTNLEVKISDAGGSDRAQEQILREFSAWQADAIYTMMSAGTLAAKSQPADIPVVFSGVAYPLQLGLVERLEFSSNQLAGIRSYIPMEEQMAFILRLVPKEIRRMVVCLNAVDPDSRMFLKEIQKLASKQGMEVVRVEVTSVPNLERNLTEVGSGVDAFYLSCDMLMQGAGARVVIDWASRRNIPILSCGMRAVEQGALAGAVVDEEAAGRMAGGQAAQILGGRMPTSLQTLTAGPPRLVVNRSAARALGVRIPQTFLGEDVHVYE